jgi:hypothetical protein
VDRVIYVGDGSSDIGVMLHVNNHDGFTPVSENRQLARIAKSTFLATARSASWSRFSTNFHWRTGSIGICSNPTD